jgi:predicted nucleic acid-binding protein
VSRIHWTPLASDDISGIHQYIGQDSTAAAVRVVDVDIGRAIALATAGGVYAYGAYMLELARSRGLPLLTLDARLSAVAQAAGIDLVEVA